MSSKCNYCTNKEQCNECDKGWKDKFIPSEGVKHYFSRGYVGVRGINGCTYSFDTTNEALVPTHSIRIDGDCYCPYCGEQMYVIQDRETLDVIGHCCICEGARSELEFEKKKKELEKKHREELYALESEYKDKLGFCSDKLFEIKQRLERKHFEFLSHNYNHFSTLNGKSYTNIEQISR